MSGSVAAVDTLTPQARLAPAMLQAIASWHPVLAQDALAWAYGLQDHIGGCPRLTARLVQMVADAHDDAQAHKAGMARWRAQDIDGLIQLRQDALAQEASQTPSLPAWRARLGLAWRYFNRTAQEA